MSPRTAPRPRTTGDRSSRSTTVSSRIESNLLRERNGEVFLHFLLPPMVTVHHEGVPGFQHPGTAPALNSRAATKSPDRGNGQGLWAFGPRADASSASAATGPHG